MSGGVFGIRIHGGEGLVSPTSLDDDTQRAYRRHVGILFRSIQRVTEHRKERQIQSRKEQMGCQMRIGHGVALASSQLDDGSTNYPCSAERLAYLHKNGIPIEINVTSNHQLLPNTGSTSLTKTKHIARDVLRSAHRGHAGPQLIFCTDDEGVFDGGRCACANNRHGSVARELCLAISRNWFPTVAFASGRHP